MDLKIIFLIILGIITSILIVTIVYQKVYIVEGINWDPLGVGKALKKAGLDPVGDFIDEIKKTINDIINGVNTIVCFVEFIIDLLKWFAHTMACIFALFIPPCPIFYIIDMFIAFVGWILGELLRLVRLEMLIDAFSAGCDGINFVTNATLGVEITDFHAWMGIKPLCYNPKFKFQPFPKYVAPKRRNYI
jgi:hypothetical protein